LIRISFALRDAKGRVAWPDTNLACGMGCERVSGGWRLRGHLADGSVGLGEDDGWEVASWGGPLLEKREKGRTLADLIPW